MSARLQGTFYSEKGMRVGVTIDDPDYTGDPVDFECLSLSINWRGDDAKERFSPIIGSECRLSILINNEDLEDFITDLVNAVEGRFTVTVGTSDGFYPQTRWCGYITTDLASIEDTPLEVGYSANLSAVDGLGVLKGIPYSSSAYYPYTGDATFVEHILNCINELGFVSTYYGSISTILRTVVNWHSDKWTYSTSIDPLDKTRVNHGAFYYVDSKGNYRFSSCYEVLEQIATAWGARIFFSGNSFWVVQTNQLQNASSNTVFAYLADGTQSIESGMELQLVHNQSNLSSSDLLRYSGGFFQFFAPLKTVQVDYRHIQARNLLAGFSVVNGDPALFEGSEIFQWPSDVFISFSANMRMQSDWISGTFTNFYVVFRIQLEIGGYYLVGGWTYGEPIWSSSPGYFYVISPFVSFASFQSLFSISFITPILGNVVSDSVTFSFALYKAYDVNGVELDIDPATGQVLISYEMFNPYLEAVGDGFFDEQSDLLRYIDTNNTYATKEYKVTTAIGDGPNSITPGHLEAYDGTNWVVADTWRVGNSGTYKPFSRLLANEIIRGQLTPVQRLVGFSFQNLNTPYLSVQPHLAIYYNSSYYGCQSGTWDLKTEIFNGDFFKLQSASGYTESEVQFVPEGTDSGVSSGSSGSGSTGSSGGGGTSTGGGATQPAVSSVVVYVQEFINTTSNVLTITENGGTLPTNAAQVDVYMNGQDLLTSQWTLGASTITIDTNTHYDSANYKVRFIIIQ